MDAQPVAAPGAEKDTTAAGQSLSEEAPASPTKALSAGAAGTQPEEEAAGKSALPDAVEPVMAMEISDAPVRSSVV